MSERRSGPSDEDAPQNPPSRATRAFRAAVFLTLLTAVGLWAATPLTPLDAGFLATLLILIPALAVVQVPLAASDGELPRIPAYAGSAIVIVILGSIGFGLGTTRSGLAGMGLASMGLADAAVWVVGMTIAALTLIGVVRWLAPFFGLFDSPLLARLLPRTRREKAYFSGLSLAAGAGEELAYRAYAVTTLQAVVASPWTAALITSGAFGVLHWYQGPLGVGRTGLIGFVFAASFVVTGNLWPAIVAHALIDLLAGLVFGETLLIRDHDEPITRQRP